MEELLFLALLFAGGAIVGKNWKKIKKGVFTREDLKQGIQELPGDAEKFGKAVAVKLGISQPQEPLTGADDAETTTQPVQPEEPPPAQPSVPEKKKTSKAQAAPKKKKKAAPKKKKA